MAIVVRFGRPGAVRLSKCTIDESIGDFVYLFSSEAGYDIVRKANPLFINRVPAVGVVISKSSDEVCNVLWDGESPPIFFDLIPGKPYFLDYNGLPTRTPVAPPGSSFLHVQALGIATATNKMYIKPHTQMTKRIFE